jgi:hypothetical protein
MEYTGFIGQLFSVIVLVTACVIFLVGAVGVLFWTWAFLLDWTIKKTSTFFKMVDIVNTAVWYKLRYKKDTSDFGDFHAWRMEQVKKREEEENGA